MRILCDTDASESFILESTLSFSTVSSLGKSVLVQGIALTCMSVPLHKVVFQSELVNGEVIMGVRPALPVGGVDVILGNNLAGERVWPDVSPLPIVTSLSTVNPVDVTAEEFSNVFPSCAVTRSKTKAANELVQGEFEEASLQKSIHYVVSGLSSSHFFQCRVNSCTAGGPDVIPVV